MAKADLSADRLRELLDYNPETGEFRWRNDLRVGRNKAFLVRKAGNIAGTKDVLGYWGLNINGCREYAHRLAWLHFYGSWPQQCVDHINGDRSDNRIANLRDISHKHNIQNQNKASKNSTTGFLGVRWYERRGKWTAQIGIDGKTVHLGYFTSPEEAHQAYLAAKRRLHEGCTI